MQDIKHSSQGIDESKKAEIFKQYLEDFAIFVESIKEKEEKILLDEITKEIKGKKIIIKNYSS